MGKRKVSICVPCYNEQDNVRPVYEAITHEMANIPQYDYEIIFRDNASTDETYERLKSIAREDNRVKIVENLANYGPGYRGVTWRPYISGNMVFSIACDLQDPIEMIPEFLAYYEQGYRVVMGQKTGSDEGRIKYLLRQIFYMIIDYFSEKKQYRHISGIALMSKEIYELACDFANQIPFRFLLAEIGYPVKLVPYQQRKRLTGKSKLKINSLLEFSLRSLVLTSTKPIHIATSVGFIGAISSFFMGVLYLMLKLMYWDEFHMGIAPIAIIVSFIGSLQLFLTGLVGEYLTVVYERVSKQVPSFVKETINVERENYFESKDKR